ncbi:YeeE/YedE family protein [Pseudooceanicola marinus]|uniref:YeeE/YedE family protein n=1 Tax=Pseudooceanicola marinus TaxID=396013 RepID=UPI001CD5D598|nr:YeeE/YedE family protein [Pseudooceanicola marinus]MCA1337564.1 YeeE/YedE family protein [Pseudooceanicola marinus]
MITEFTPLTSAFGGALVGLSAVLLMALHGRILGATGIVGGLMRFDNASDWALRAALLLGMLAAPTALLLVTGTGPTIDIPVSTPAILLSGVIVGFGTFFGGGCTSGHGICGNARFSRRSITATISFMIGAFVTVFVIRHVIGV